jgi:hypothetical protein
MIFDVSSRAVGCPEQLLDLEPSLSASQKKIQQREFLRAVQTPRAFDIYRDDEYSMKTVTMKIA